MMMIMVVVVVKDDDSMPVRSLKTSAFSPSLPLSTTRSATVRFLFFHFLSERFNHSCVSTFQSPKGRPCIANAAGEQAEEDEDEDEDDTGLAFVSTSGC